jgi:hypothetical protein
LPLSVYGWEGVCMCVCLSVLWKSFDGMKGSWYFQDYIPTVYNFNKNSDLLNSIKVLKMPSLYPWFSLLYKSLGLNEISSNWYAHKMSHDNLLTHPGNTKGGSITVLLTSCLTGLESLVWQLAIFVFICKTD